MNEAAAAQAVYRQGEVHRLRGELRRGRGRLPGGAAAAGWEPQPGLALLRLAQGKDDAGGRRDPPGAGRDLRAARARAGLLPAYVEIMLAVGDARRRRAARCRELEEIAERCGGRRAGRDGRAGARSGRASPRATPGRRWSRCVAPWRVWQELEAPYEAARVRVLMGLACRALGDDDMAALELEAARGVVRAAGSGAGPRPRRLARAARRRRTIRTGSRSVSCEVLRLVAAGKSNREIAAELVHQRAHRRPAPAEHLRQARRVVADRGERVRLRARARLTRAWSEMTTPAAAAKLVIPRDAAGRPQLVASLRRSNDGATTWRHGTKRQRDAPRRDDARERLLAGIPVTERRLQLAGVSTAVLEGGDGPPVVLLHGPAGNAAHWMRVIPDLVTTHRVIAPDLPGHGSSEVADGAARRRSRARVARRADRAHLPVAAGAGRATRSAAPSRPASPPTTADRLSRLVLVDALGLAPFEPAPEFGLALNDFLAEPTERTHDAALAPLRARPGRLAPADGRALGAVQGIQRRPCPHAEREGRARQPMEQFGMPAIPPADLARIAVPTTLIWGRHDLATPAGGRRGRERPLRLAAARDRGRGRRPADRTARGVRARAARRARSAHADGLCGRGAGSAARSSAAGTRATTSCARSSTG